MGRTVERRDTGQKLFQVGDHTACVVAGNVASSISGDGFFLQDSVATEIELQNRVLARNHELAERESAGEFSAFFQSRFTGVLSLIDAETTVLSNPVFGMSAASFRPDGRRDWVSYYQEYGVATDASGRRLYLAGAVTLIPPLFHIVAIGSGSSLVNDVISRDAPSKQLSFSNSSIMRRYYKLKSSGKLDRLSLSEAQEIAAGLVQDAIERAKVEDGIGGPVDVATLSKDGFRWIRRKQVTDPLTPIYRSRFINYVSRNDGNIQSLDGFECVRCTFWNAKFSYRGDGDFRLVHPIFHDQCTVIVSPEAKRTMAEAVERIKRVMGEDCKIIELPESPKSKN